MYLLYPLLVGLAPSYSVCLRVCDEVQICVTRETSMRKLAVREAHANCWSC